MKPGRWFEEVDELRDQFEPFFLQEVFDCGKMRLKRGFSIARLEHDASIVDRLDPNASIKRKGKVNGGGAGMEQIKRPDVDRAARQVDSGRCSGFDDHCRFSIADCRFSNGVSAFTVARC